MSSGSNTMIVGSNITFQNHTSRGMDILMGWVERDAFHNSRGLCDTLKCHPNTRLDVLDDIMEWVNESELARKEFIMWLFGPAGGGKSAIAKRIAELATEGGLLIGDFFFSESSDSTHNTTERLIATLAYQLALSIPETRSYIGDAVERDPAIFNKDVPTQIDTLFIKPFQSISSSQIVPSQKLIIIDGLDQCIDSKAQVAVLEAISRSVAENYLPVIFLVASRPEPDIVTSFDCNEPLKSIHCRLALDSAYQPDDDVRRFFSDKFKDIKRTHPLRSTIPITWPTQEKLDTLVKQSSGQFIYASTAIEFIESTDHHPPARLNVILGISPPENMNPFAKLDALYHNLLSSVEDIQTTLRVLSFYVIASDFASMLLSSPITPADFLKLKPGDILLSLSKLSSILTYNKISGAVEIMHASFVAFLSDHHRSAVFHIDRDSTIIDFLRRILECVKGPDGVRAGDVRLFRGVLSLRPHGQLPSDILNFDLDAFITDSIGCYKTGSRLCIPGSTIEAFDIWKEFLADADSQDSNKALNQLHQSLESRLETYQYDWRLQLLLTLGVTEISYPRFRAIPFCRYVDILLGMDEQHYLHLLDREALDLRHSYTYHPLNITSHVDGEAYASAALHCMRFLSSPPDHFEGNERPEMGLIYEEWMATCKMTLIILRELLKQANTSQELVQFISRHDIHPTVKGRFSANLIWDLNEIILKFLNRANVCTEVQRSREITDDLYGDWISDEEGWSSDHDEEWITAPEYLRHRLDSPCCSNVHRYRSH